MICRELLARLAGLRAPFRQGGVRVYFDDEADPAIDMLFINWFEKQP